MKVQPLIVVKDVELSSQWYQKLLDCQSGHGGKEYERLLFDENIILQLHASDTHGHEYLKYDTSSSRASSMLLWFQTDKYDAATQRVKNLGVEVLEASHVNELANHRECWVRDLDGYVVVIASAYGDIG